MTFRELLTSAYQWADAHALALLLASLAWGLGGTLLARVAKGGRTDQDGRVIASVVIGGAALLLMLALLAAGVAHLAFRQGLMDANALLLLAPLGCVLVSVLGMHQVFPLSELASVRTLRDLAVFALACIALLWLLSTFRGWGVAFLGGLGSLALIGLLAGLLLRVLYRRAFGHCGRSVVRAVANQLDVSRALARRFGVRAQFGDTLATSPTVSGRIGIRPQICYTACPVERSRSSSRQTEAIGQCWGVDSADVGGDFKKRAAESPRHSPCPHPGCCGQTLATRIQPASKRSEQISAAI